MPPARPKYSKTAVQKAGKRLLLADIVTAEPEKYKECMDILSNWRARHIGALNRVTLELERLAAKEDHEAVVVNRLKRTPSIITKLQRNPSMNLNRMQDIAGCRAIVKNVKKAGKIRRSLKKQYLLKETDYIAKPKQDGYRGIHLIGKFAGNTDNDKYNVEIQVRTKLQHAWATAVEIVDIFTNQTLKSNIGAPRWKDFFRHAANEFAKAEGAEYSQSMNSEAELARLIRSLDIYKQFAAFQLSLRGLENHPRNPKHSFYLINIDTATSTGVMTPFEERDFEVASLKYLEYEKLAARNPRLVIALVSVSSVGNLKDAFPNYFADSTLFIETLRSVQGHKPGKFVQFVTRWLASTGLGGR